MKLNQFKTFQSNVGINLSYIKDKKVGGFEATIFRILEKMISSNLLKEQKIIFEVQKNDYNYFFKKVYNVAYQYRN